ncbi:MAG: SDR family oxidoreductase [Bifidobacteriaceae bacterium]|nr:SDR family oxidoreductase [Bifidobacteriaceae bacterium]
MSGALAGRLAVVTAGTRGIGRAVVDRFVAEGAHVVTSARTAASGEELVATHGDKVTFVVADAAKTADLPALVQAVKAQGRPLDVIVTNAGGGPHTWLRSPEADYEAVMDVTVRSALFAVQALEPLLRDGAAIVLIGSISGSNGGPGAIVYNAAKAAIRSLARSLAAELGGRRIRANVVSPGPTLTPGFQVYMNNDQAAIDQMGESIPLGRAGQPAEVAAAVLFMACDESSFIDGAELVVDGGMSQV